MVFGARGSDGKGIIMGRGLLYDASSDGQKFIIAEESTGAASPLAGRNPELAALLKR